MPYSPKYMGIWHGAILFRYGRIKQHLDTHKLFNSNELHEGMMEV